ncbi:carbohydrate ABC transporter permease [Meiothermus granaticius]|uniref:sn-glycerol-3-phosphate transport system permease protein UgpA n=1 Tax=Meiothermus granaticius NBRC 107808 TaxID=1227551 RepID=A0A399F6D2_9DEIN|nr:sugar ABC transporter permease [Meiothermus granaticius]RIH91650.1 sn-glycerol-3-phosphate transport system permease protein UgpA [Meiothermus granaticius NBRC 107808]GEM88387.1 sugar ABC transporter permease [Meiothermus granaticius NBRC 107808]
MRRFEGLLFGLPGLLVLAGVVGVPLFYTLGISLTRYTFLRPRWDWIGFQNYFELLQDAYFVHALTVSAVYVALTVGLSLGLGLLLAVLLQQPVPFRGLHYFAVSLPMLIAPVGVGLIWKMLLHPELGPLGSLMGLDFLGDARLALLTLALIDVWQQVSLVALILLAGLRSLPKEPLEAAFVDGATPFQRFRYITLPLLRPVLLILLILQTVAELRTYDLVYVLTRGGPGNATELVSYFIYRKAFLGLDLSAASAMAFVLLLLSLGLVALYYRLLLRD